MSKGRKVTANRLENGIYRIPGNHPRMKEADTWYPGVPCCKSPVFRRLYPRLAGCYGISISRNEDYGFIVHISPKVGGDLIEAHGITRADALKEGEDLLREYTAPVVRRSSTAENRLVFTSPLLNARFVRMNKRFDSLTGKCQIIEPLQID